MSIDDSLLKLVE